MKNSHNSEDQKSDKNAENKGQTWEISAGNMNPIDC